MRTILHRLAVAVLTFFAFALPAAAQGLSPSFALSGLPESSVPGQPLSVTVGVSGGAGPATGTVAFDLRNLGTNGVSSICGATTLDAMGNASCGFVVPVAGTWQVEISYLGDLNYNPGSTTWLFNVQQAAPLITIIGLPENAVPGTTISAYAQVSSSSPTGNPTGWADFSLRNPSTGGVTSLCSEVSLDVDGKAPCSFTAPPAGGWDLLVHYYGDSANSPADGSFPFSTTQSGVAITLSGLISTVPGASLSLTSNVSGGSGVPTGTVTFVEHSLSSNGRSIRCGSVGIDPSGNSSCAYTTPPNGNYEIEVSYSGDESHSSATQAFAFTTAQAGVTITLSGLVNTVPGASLSLTSNVSSASPLGTPTGTVTFVEHSLSSNGRSIRCGSVPIDPSGNSPCAYTTPPNGSYEIEVTYSGDASNAASTRAFGFFVANVPGAPVMGSATAGNGRATVTFSPPGSDGGASIYSYTVVSNPGGITASSSGSPIVVTGLANGSTYTFTVFATNSVGSGPASGPSNAVTPTAPPPAPITYTFSGTVTGTFGTNAFTDAAITVNAVGDANLVVSLGGGLYCNLLTSVSVTVAGAGSGVATDTPLAVFANDPIVAVGIQRGCDTTDWIGMYAPPGTPSASALSTYALNSAVSATGQSPYVQSDLNTTAGVLHITTTNITQFNAAGGAAPPPPTAPAVQLSPTALNFAARAIGSPSPAQTVTLTNTGNAPLAIASIAASGDFAISGTTTCSTSAALAGGASCGIDVTFTPTAPGTRSGTLSVSSNASGSPHTVALSGSGSAPIGLPAAPVIGTASINPKNPAQVDVSFSPPASNGGSAITGYTATSSPGAVSASGTGSPITVTGLSTCVVYTFTVTATNAVGTGGPSAASNGISLAAPTPAAPPPPFFTPASVVFASRTLATTSAAQTITITNGGACPISLTSMAIAGDFAFVSACPATLAAGATCTVDVTFTPLVVGARTGSLTVNMAAFNGTPGQQVLPLSGTGAPGTVPVASVSTSGLDYPVQPVGSDSAAELVTVQNTGTATLTFGAINVSGDFRQVALPAGNTATACPVNLAPGASCQIAVVFHPTAVNLRTGTLSIVTNAGNSPTNVALAGTGLIPSVPQLRVPASLAFGSQPVGTKSAGTAVALANTSSVIATITELSASGDFSVSDTCTTIVAATTCSPLVFFQPTQIGPRTGTLTVRTLRDLDPYVVDLTGTGEENLRPVLHLSATRVGFGNAYVGSASHARIDVQNVGQGPLVIESIVGTGSYLVTHGCTTLLPGASCTIDVTFLPGTTGSQGGVIEIRSNADGSPHRIDLSGTGCFVPSPSRARLGLLLCGP